MMPREFASLGFEHLQVTARWDSSFWSDLIRASFEKLRGRKHAVSGPTEIPGFHVPGFIFYRQLAAYWE